MLLKMAVSLPLLWYTLSLFHTDSLFTLINFHFIDSEFNVIITFHYLYCTYFGYDTHTPRLLQHTANPSKCIFITELLLMQPSAAPTQLTPLRAWWQLNYNFILMLSRLGVVFLGQSQVMVQLRCNHTCLWLGHFSEVNLLLICC